MSSESNTFSSPEYKFKLIDYARDILRDSGSNYTHNYEKKVLALAETIHAWVKKDLDTE